MLSGTGKHVAIIELGIRGQTPFFPMRHERVSNYGRLHVGAQPRSTPPSMQGDSIQNRDGLSAFQVEAVHEVGLIDLGASGRYLRQIPGGLRWRAPNALSGIEKTLAFENTVDGRHRRNLGRAEIGLLQEMVSDSI